MAPPRLFCFGFGYSAEALAIRLTAAGYQIAGTCRSAAKREQLQAMGMQAYLFDRGRPLEYAAAALAGTTHLLSSVPPDVAGDPVLDQHAADIARLGELAWAGYLSTTGVYGDRQGGWVDESAPLTPSTTRGHRRVAAEAAWQKLGLPLHLFRLAGIYGPGRSQIDSVRAGTAQRIDKPGQVFSRIHVDDIAAVLAASIARPDPGAAYNVCDDEPAPPADVVAYACELLGVPVPPLIPFDAARLSEMGRSFFAESKRVSNTRVKTELGVHLRYPTYREGLKAVAASIA